jgi:predicted dehydrogenase
VSVVWGNPVSRLSAVYRWPSTETGGYVNLFRNLAAVIRDGAEQDVKWEESALVVEIIELAHQSSREKRTVVIDG